MPRLVYVENIPANIEYNCCNIDVYIKRVHLHVICYVIVISVCLVRLKVANLLQTRYVRSYKNLPIYERNISFKKRNNAYALAMLIISV